jgi:hypothetical protein
MGRERMAVRERRISREAHGAGKAEDLSNVSI